jgi:signal transduction histidine kinase/ligand-binding sensor domain-containing protein
MEHALHHRLRGALCLLVFALLPGVSRGSAGAGRVLENYHHNAWSSESGLGLVFEVTQAADGYLWLSTSKGVYRFDGVRFQAVSEATNHAVRDGDVDGAWASAHGGVWLTTRSRGLLLWKGARLFDFPDRRCTEGRRPDGMVEDRDGSLWIAASSGLAHLHQGVCEIVRAEGYPGGFPAALLLDRAGTLWLKMPAGDLLFRRRGESGFQRSAAGAGQVHSFAYLHEAPNGDVWLSDSRGLRRVHVGGTAPSTGEPPQAGGTSHDQFGNFTFDREGNLWAASRQGMVRFAQVDRTPPGASLTAVAGESYDTADGLSSDNVRSIMVDREGVVWAATSSGLDRFRRNVFSVVPVPSSQDYQLGVAAGRDGSVWVGSRSLPLTHITMEGSSQSFPETVQTLAIRRDLQGEIWSSGKGTAGLWRTEGSRVVPVSYPNDNLDSCASMAVDRNGDLWISTFGPNVYRRTAGGEWVKQNDALGRKPGVIGTMSGDSEGNVWFAFSNRVVEWDGRTFHRFEFPDGELNISVTTLAMRRGRLWMGGSGGVVLLRDGVFRKMRWQQESLPGRVSGLVETPDGDLWINGYSGVVHVPAAELSRWVREPDYAVNAEQFDALDGLPSLAGERYPEPSLAQSPEGRLWFGTVHGVAWLDPQALEERRNRLAPPVAVEAIVAGEKNYMGADPIRLPAHTESVEFDYTALSMALPERVRFRYRLDGVDRDWQNASTRRQAFYTNLAPGRYRFHVTACNNDGVWNRDGAYIDFNIDPAFYQMWPFRVLVAMLLGVLLWAIVQKRISSVTAQMRARMAARSDERERIARELHDTLLQSLFGVMLQFHAIANRLSQEDPTKQVLSETLHRADSVMQEGRERVRDLRSTETDSGALMDALSTTGYQLQALRPVGFEIAARGRPRPLNADIQEEILLIGREALTNAFVHSQAQEIAVELNFRGKHLLLVVEDNGRGIDEQVLRAGGREGHWGLRGMRERAGKIRSRLEIERAAAGGTRVSLRVPARIVYAAQPGRWGDLWRRLRGER